MGEHIIDGKFQSDKYPNTPRGLIPFKATDTMAQDLLWEYAQRRRAVDAVFADDLEWVLRKAGYHPSERVEVPVMVPADMLDSFLTQKQVNQFHDLYQFLTDFMFYAEIAYEKHTGTLRAHRDRERESAAVTEREALEALSETWRMWWESQPEWSDISDTSETAFIDHTETVVARFFKEYLPEQLAALTAAPAITKARQMGDPRRLHAAPAEATEPMCDADKGCKPYAELSVKAYPAAKGVCSIHGGKFQPAERAEGGGAE